MATGQVDPATVTKIVAGTAAKDDEGWNHVIESYRHSYWHGFEDKAEALLRQFIAEGKVEQPRLNGDVQWFPSHNRRDQHWVESEDQIKLRTFDDHMPVA